MTGKTLEYAEQLIEWQERLYEDIDTADDVLVFNVIGTIIGLVNAELLLVSTVSDFINLLSIKEDVKERILKAHNEALDNISKKH